MVKNISDRNGRALEFAIVNVLLEKIPNLISLGNTLLDQQRDSAKFEMLPDWQQAHFIKSAETVFAWLATKSTLDNASIERLTDDAAKKGDVTDIRFISSGHVINLSIKHNHTALKHQRPGATAAQCGYAKISPADINYRVAYKKITDDFLKTADALKKGAQDFSELKLIQTDFIDKQLYAPMCDLVCDFLNSYASQQANNAQHFFSFIVGMTNYHKIVVYAEKIEICEFAFMPSVDSLSAVRKGASYIEVYFSNEWAIAMRLHTASSKIKGVSLKFDTQLLNMKVPTETIPLS
ncbi:MAG: HaeIII family restriction endonuclease [Methylococcaceae bacterium]|nr:HaeIII family restriction endonuclease [Methylococcaceae bacterium]